MINLPKVVNLNDILQFLRNIGLQSSSLLRNFENELIPGLLVKRYKRFFADIKLKNKIITAHCPNSGSMFNLLEEGNPVWFTESTNDKRKLKYTLQIIEVDGIKFCINTHITNKVIKEALENPRNSAPEFIFQRTVSPEKAPN